MFKVTHEPINPEQLKEQSKDDKAGSFVVFEGWVRNHNEGKKVASLEYEVFESLALKEAKKVIDEAKEKFDILDVTAVHRAGHIAIGDIAVWIGVSSKHREPGFHACKYIIDEIKLRLPIWKKEYYVDGEATWVNCQGCYKHAHNHHTEEQYYDKQLRLKNLGPEGQTRLKNAKVLVVGAGGLGCPALSYLVSAGVGNITICDGDHLEVSNLHRQTLYAHSDIGEYKAVLAKKRLKGLNPFVTINAITKRVSFDNINELVSMHDLVLDCTDNFESKFLIHDACYFLNKPLVQASIYQSEGQLQSFTFKKDSGCQRCLWPEVPSPDSVGNCAEVGVIGVVPGVLGTMQATEALKILLNWGSSTDSSTLLVDLMNWSVSKIKRSKNKSCPLCGDKPKIKGLSKNHYGRLDFELELSELTDEDLAKYKFIDIRELNEKDHHAAWENFLLQKPLSLFENDFNPASQVDPIILVCQRGARSKTLAQKLRLSGATGVFSLNRGVSSVRENWGRIQGAQCQ